MRRMYSPKAAIIEKAENHVCAGGGGKAMGRAQVKASETGVCVRAKMRI